MEQFEMVEKLRERADVSYEEAKEALEKSNWDVLDAMIYLEKNGKTKAPGKESYSTQEEPPVFEIPEQDKTNGFSDNMKRFGKWCMKMIDIGNRNQFAVQKDGEEKFAIPVTLLVVLLLFAFWVVLPLMIVGLFFDLRYHFVGPDIREVKVDINRTMDDVADAAENIKKEF